jgi:glutamate-5-semialdehyde dehydrogenase
MRVSQPIRAPRRFSLLTALLILFALIAAQVIATWFIATLYEVGTISGLYVTAHDDPSIEAALTIAAQLAAFGMVMALALVRNDETWRSLGRWSFAPPLVAIAFLPIVASMPIFISEIDNLLRALNWERGLDDWDFVPDLDRLVTGSWLGVLLAVIIAPFTEEIVFRGLILRGLLGRWKPWIAIAISSALFALMHFNPAQAPIAFTFGAVLGWVYVRTRSLGLCILGHAMNNAAAYLPANIPIAVDNYNHVPDPAAGFFHPWWFDLAGLALFGGGVWILHRLVPAATPWQVPPAAEPPLLQSPRVPPLLVNPSKSLGVHPGVDETGGQMSAALIQLVTSLAERARAASLLLATAPRAKKDAALEKLAELIDASHFELLQANQRDLLSPEAGALSDASRERLTLSEAKLRQLSASVREVVALTDPVGEVLEEFTRPNGLRIRKIRVPIGVIGIIYEARPNVTIDCAILCLKSGNASILRGGKECFHTNMALAALIQGALAAADLPADAVQLVPTTDRNALTALLKLDTLIHCIIPRGGESLIRFVAENSTIPVIKHFKGVCFVYVDEAADLRMAEAITVNAKVSRPSVCNAAEQLLVHRNVAPQFLPTAARALVAKGVQLRCDPASAAILERETIPTTPATAADFRTEFLDYVLAVRVVDSLDSAIATINRDSSNHSDAIVTADEKAARRFLAEVDSATVYWNASTRFTDGYEFGYGAEIGISTDRLHARGPMGLPELCSYKFIIEGNGQIRN